MNKVSPQSILHTVEPKTKVHFVRKLISTKIVQPKKGLSISDVINLSKNISDFKENLSVFTNDYIETIKNLTMSKSENEHWFEYRKCPITVSKSHEVVNKMTKVGKGGGGTVDMWSLNQKVSGLLFFKTKYSCSKI